MGIKFRRWFYYLLIVVILAGGVVRFAVQRVDFYGNSMNPTFVEGDVLLVEKLSVRFTDIRRFDVVVFRYLYQDDQYYIKRVVGLPGETIQIMDGAVWLDGSPLEDEYGTVPIEDPGRASEPILLGENEYFVLGDNRNDSSDSRDSDIANVSKSQMIGKVVMRIWHVKKEKTK